MTSNAEYLKNVEEQIERELKEEPTFKEIPELTERPTAFMAEIHHEDFTEIPYQSKGNGSHPYQGNVYVDCLQREEVHFYRELTSYHKSVRSIVIFCKRIIRKLVRFLSEPMVMEINCCRQLTVSALREIDQQLAWQNGFLQTLDTAQAELEGLRQENLALRTRLERMEEAMRDLRNEGVRG